MGPARQRGTGPDTGLWFLAPVALGPAAAADQDQPLHKASEGIAPRLVDPANDVTYTQRHVRSLFCVFSLLLKNIFLLLLSQKMYYGDAIAIYKLATVYYSFSKLSPEQMTFAIANLKLNMLNLFVIGAFRHPFLALVPLMRILWYPILAKKIHHG